MNIIQKHYNQKSQEYQMSAIRLKKILEICKDVKNKDVLDVGCSTGYLGYELAKRGAQVTGIDISKTALKKASKLLFKVKVTDLNEGKLPFKNKTFDLVIASEVVEHLFNPGIIFKEFNRVLKNNGQLIITTPNLLYWAHRIKFLAGSFQYTNEGPFDEGHIHFYTYKTLLEDLKKTGFNPIVENHVYAGNLFLDVVRRIMPALFAYQFVLKAKK